MYLTRETIGNKVKDLREGSSQQKRREGNKENLSLHVTRLLNTDFAFGCVETEFWETVSPNYRLVSSTQRWTRREGKMS